ncbi:hypothetical protein DFJ73DRAFT_771273 [Zopfochytrium polystomum]|nr:hypothetical protein DFJ73DRAFT_771273 [Zopfochytrium polystomum]
MAQETLYLENIKDLEVETIEMTRVIAVVSLVAILCVTAMKTPEEIRAGNWSLDDWGKFGPYNAEGEYIDPETECDGQPCPPLLPLGEPHPWKPGPPSPTCIQVTEEIQHCNYLPEGYIDVTYEEFLALEAESLTESHDEEEKKKSQPTIRQPAHP